MPLITLQHEFEMPNARPILANYARTYLIVSGNQKYYTWNGLCYEVYGVSTKDSTLRKFLLL